MEPVHSRQESGTHIEWDASGAQVPRWEVLWYGILYYDLLYYTILYYTILYYTILYYTILYYTRTTYQLVQTLVPQSRMPEVWAAWDACFVIVLEAPIPKRTFGDKTSLCVTNTCSDKRDPTPRNLIASL